MPEQHQDDGGDAEPAACMNQRDQRTGKSAVAGTEAAIWASGCAMRARRGWKPMATPTGMVQRAAMSSESIHAQERSARALEDLEDICAAVLLTQQQQSVEGGKDGGGQKSEEDGAVGDERTLARCGALRSGRGRARRRACGDGSR